MKAMQILQTIMLAIITGGGYWCWNTITDSHAAIKRIEPELIRISTKQEWLIGESAKHDKEIEVLSVREENTDRRVGILETKIK